MKRTIVSATIIILLALGAVPLGAQTPAPWAAGVSRPQDLVVQLVTIGPADPIYTWWGHSALIVEDSRLGVSRFYNYGLFSFMQDSFVRNFVMGRLWFQVGASDTERELAFYRYLGRTIHIQILNLSPSKRMQMALFLEENILPQNRTYLYDHYYDNCATRVRDLIDTTLDGQLAEAAAVSGRMTLRQHTRRFTAHDAFMDWLLMFLMSGMIDRSITKWEEMFLPEELEANVAALRYQDETGTERQLVERSILYYEAEQLGRPLENAPPLWPKALIPSALLALVGVLAAVFTRYEGRSRTGWLLFGIHGALLGLLMGIPGAVLLFMSRFTDHTVTYANENLFLANPLVLAALPLGLIVAFGGKRRCRRLLQLLWLLSSAIAAVYLLLKGFAVFAQQNAPALALYVPLLGAAAAAAVLSWKRA